MNEKAKRQKRRERRKRARRDLENNKTKAEVHKPATHDNRGNPQEHKNQLPEITHTVTDDAPGAAGKPKKGGASEKGKYAKYIVRPFVTVWRVLFAFLDKHSGSITALATVAIVILTFVYVKYSKKQWEVAQDSLRVSQSAYVTIGRKDGTVAEFRKSQDKRFNDGLVIYFENSGHLPAKFNWGLQKWFAQPAANPPLPPTPNEFHPMTHTRNRKTGAITETVSNGGTIGGDSVQAFNVGELPSSFVDSLSQSNQLFQVDGIYEYCDELGRYSCKAFTLIYHRIPYDRFVLIYETECVDRAYLGNVNPGPDEEELPLCSNQETPRFPNR